MTRSRINCHVENGTVAVRGWRVAELLKSVSIRAVFARGAWLFDEHRLPDLLAELQRRHIAVEVIGVLPPQEKSTLGGQRPEETSSMDVPLWGGEAS